MTMGHGDHGDHGAPMTSGWRCAKLLWGWAPCDDRKGPDESTGTGSWSHDLSWLWPEILLVLMVLMAVLMALMATIVRYMPWIENDRDINQYKYRITHTEIVLYTVYIYNIYVCVCVRVNLLCWPGCGVLPCSCRTAFAGCAETSVSEQFAAHSSLS